MASSSNFSFVPGLRFVLDGCDYTFESYLPGDKVHAARTITREPVVWKLDELLNAYDTGRLIAVEAVARKAIGFDAPAPVREFGALLGSLPKKAQQAVLAIKPYVNAYLESPAKVKWIESSAGVLIRDTAARIADTEPPSITKLWRAVKAVVQAKCDLRALIKTRKRRSKARVYSQETIDRIKGLLERFWLIEKRPSLVSVYEDRIYPDFKREGAVVVGTSDIIIPKLSVVRRVARQFEAYDIVAARYGEAHARSEFRRGMKGPHTDRVLQISEMDFAWLDLFVLDDISLLPLGHPRVALQLDRHCRIPKGISVSFSGESIDAMFRCVRHGALPKHYLKATYPAIMNPWPVYGMEERIHVDNFAAGHSIAVEEAEFQLGTTIAFMQTQGPWFKATVERFIRTESDALISNIDGKTFAKYYQRFGYDPVKHAVITFSDLVEAIHRWAIDVYAQKWHSGIRCAPIEKWLRGIENCPPPLPIDRGSLDVVFGRRVARILTQQGIRTHSGRRYNNSELHQLIREFGTHQKVFCRLHDWNIGFVHVEHPKTGHLIRVDELEPEYSDGLTVQQHRMISIKERQDYRTSGRLENLLLAKANLVKWLEDRGIANSLRQRALAARIRGTSSETLYVEPERPLAKPLLNLRLPETVIDPAAIPDFSSGYAAYANPWGDQLPISVIRPH